MAQEIAQIAARRSGWRRVLIGVEHAGHIGAGCGRMLLGLGAADRQHGFRLARFQFGQGASDHARVGQQGLYLRGNATSALAVARVVPS
jgi:hypothetical protein